MPYGGKLLNQSEIKNELIDHTQYLRVQKQPSGEQIIFRDRALWGTSIENRFSSFNKRKKEALKLGDLDEIRNL